MKEIIVKVLEDGRRVTSEGKLLPKTKEVVYVQTTIFDFLEEGKK